ncbi:MAG TPA: ammonia-forming cytochrome c nitrite reductase subunit c552 [Thermoflexus sp.]|nr:ammonia-forming cytochrome c nitrite reductase subunit c552 [Thermoflexus sp.]
MFQRMPPLWLRVVGFVLLVAVLGLALAFLIIQIRGPRLEVVRPVTIPEGETNPAVWGLAFPREYQTWLRTKEGRKTLFAGSIPYDKLEEDPRLRILWEGYPFAVEYGEDRGHAYSVEDVLKTKRIQVLAQKRGGSAPGTCWTCKSADVPRLMAEMGPANFYATPFEQLRERIQHPVSCANCHDPKTMAPTIKHVALQEALQKMGKDIHNLSRQELRILTCAQCHVEYYFAKEPKDYLVFPWEKGTRFEDIEAYYNERNFADWVHPSTGVPVVKFQHPEFELYTANSTHYLAGVACADCHMPFVIEGGIKYTSHQAASPWYRMEQACGTCHLDIPFIRKRVEIIQTITKGLQDAAEVALVEAIEALKAIKDNPNADPKLAEEARTLFRKAHMRWDFVSAENSLGFHNPQEAMRLLAESINFARQAQLKAIQALQRPQARVP